MKKNKFLKFWTAFLLMAILGGTVLASEPASAEASAISAEKKQEAKEKPLVEVVFVLDSTGSMSGLIEGAKQKIWSIANKMILQEPQPEVKMGLLTYRDRGDEYVTKMYDLSEDIDAIYGYLQEIKAEGGGDTPESVNQALEEASKMSWTAKEKNVYRVIFLVGDAPPHMDYPDDIKYQEICKKTLENNIIINTIQCGNIHSCTSAWKEIAKLAEGEFSQISQDGNMKMTASPYDAEIEKLTMELNATVIPYGSMRQQAEVQEKLRKTEKMSASVKADRAVFNAHSQAVAIQGRGDLLADMSENSTLLEKAEDLPEDLQKMSLEERKKYVEAQNTKRKEINAKIVELTKQRTQWLTTEEKKKRSEIEKYRREKVVMKANEMNSEESFDEKVSEIIRQQMNQKLKK
ncbi:MAG: vWA domain-containing protein [Planctomycetia bacterium]|nr:vWA domain-containing protein [Planctomycetia bacterium]